MNSRVMPLIRTGGAWVFLALLEAGAQVSMKLAAADASAGDGAWAPLGVLLQSPLFLLSILCDALGFLVWMALLARHDLSVVVPVSASSYFTIILASHYILAEPFSMIQIAGLVLIGFGIVLIAAE